MGFSVRLGKGVRVRATSRGIRVSAGPRAARLHFGSGRPGFSTGFGPVTYYTPLGKPLSNSPSSASHQLQKLIQNGADRTTSYHHNGNS